MAVAAEVLCHTRGCNTLGLHRHCRACGQLVFERHQFCDDCKTERSTGRLPASSIKYVWWDLVERIFVSKNGGVRYDP